MSTPHPILKDVIRHRYWDQCKAIIGKNLHDFLSERFEFLNTRGKFSILEIGCGEGNTIAELSHKYPNSVTVGLDIDNNNCLTIHNKPVFIECDVQNMQKLQLTNTFDCVIAIAVMPYVPNKVLAILNIWDSLKIKGIAVISVNPYHFGPYAIEMFANGDIKWDHNLQALVIHKSSLKAHASILPCLNYLYLEYCQFSHVILDKKFSCWPSFLAFPVELHPWLNQEMEKRPYAQSVVSIYVPTTESLQSPDALFKNKDGYPAVMVKHPTSANRIVHHYTFVPLCAIECSPITEDEDNTADKLHHIKEEWRQLLIKAQFNSDSIPSMCRQPVTWLSSSLQAQMASARRVTEQYLASQGNTNHLSF